MNREIKRRANVVQVFPSRKSLIRLLGAVLSEMDEEWAARRWFTEESIAEVFEDRSRWRPGRRRRTRALRQSMPRASSAS